MSFPLDVIHDDFDYRDNPALSQHEDFSEAIFLSRWCHRDHESLLNSLETISRLLNAST